MSKRLVKAYGLMLVVVTAASGQQPSQGYQNETKAPWLVSVVHTIDVYKLVERYRSEPNVQVGISPAAPSNTLNITTGLVIDSEGHVVTRLVTLDPKEKNPNIIVTASDGSKHQARLVGVDCATGFSVLQSDSLKVALPNFAPSSNLPDGADVRVLSTSGARKAGAADRGLYISPAISVVVGRVNINSVYAKARGALTVLSPRLLSRNDSSVVITPDSAVVGIAQFAGFGRAYLYPIEFIRGVVVKRVLDRKASVPSGWLGVVTGGAARPTTAAASGAGRGVVVAEVKPDSPAAKCGLRPNDVIVGLDDIEVRGTSDLSAVLSSSPAGRVVKLKALREKEPVVLDVELGPRDCSAPSLPLAFEDHPGESLEEQLRDIDKRSADLQIIFNSYSKIPPSSWRQRDEALAEIQIEMDQLRRHRDEIERQQRRVADNVGAPEDHKHAVSPFGMKTPAGFSVFELTDQLAAEYFKTSTGLLVTMVDNGSPAEIAGLKAGDVIVGTLERGKLPASSLKAMLLNQRRPITLRVVRNKREQILVRLSHPANRPGPAPTPRRDPGRPD